MPQDLGTYGRTDVRTDECNSICLPLCGGIKIQKFNLAKIFTFLRLF